MTPYCLVPSLNAEPWFRAEEGKRVFTTLPSTFFCSNPVAAKRDFSADTISLPFSLSAGPPLPRALTGVLALCAGSHRVGVAFARNCLVTEWSFLALISDLLRRCLAAGRGAGGAAWMLMRGIAGEGEVGSAVEERARGGLGEGGAGGALEACSSSRSF